MAIELIPEDILPNVDRTGNHHLVEKDIADKIRPLMIASIIFYGKAFTTADGRKLKAEKNWLSDEYTSMHDYIMDVRNNFVAHGGVGDYEKSETVILLVPKNKKEIIYFPTNTRGQMNMFLSADGGADVLKHFDHAISIVNDKYHALFPRLVEIAKSRSLVFWMSAAQAGEAIQIDNFKK
ncbi:hypothetical protein [Citrobacter sp. JGM124]|uniref:hypothetical protein n=1 Tax=Citrobacter sp. JGM124 TaxID=2799789 RepID=UPI001BA8CC88|nr:hypothetical protein [Citrobacter sp. JGM124]MBS0847583.1 hypothetical protein [Citrobacter sp. JGM124]